jgi:glycosyltransferase involved in cell wall biosynthesis
MSGPDVLFIHKWFPTQFEFLAEALDARAVRWGAIAYKAAPGQGPNVKHWWIDELPKVGLLFDQAQWDMARARMAAEAALQFRAEGLRPGVIIGHPHWGETLLMRDVFPEAKLIIYAELFNRLGTVEGFDPEDGELSLEERFLVTAGTLSIPAALADADHIVSPTAFQKSMFPKLLRPHIEVIHEGVDVERIRPKRDAQVVLPNGVKMRRGDPLITHVARVLEPLRGFRTFMRALPRLLAERPDAQVLIIGRSGSLGYGRPTPDGRTWTKRLLEELDGRLDLSRVHFVGAVPHEHMLHALSASAAHVYYTYPYGLSWSLTEAMACECYVIGSDTAPVRDAITDGENGRLLDFFDPDALAAALIDACDRPERFEPLRKAARRTVVERFNRKDSLAAWLQLIDEGLPGVASATPLPEPAPL